MMYSFQNHIQTVNTLKEICKMRKEGYTKAAEYIKDKELQKLFVKYAKQSDDFEYELLRYSDQPTANSEGFEGYNPSGWKDFEERLEELSPEHILGLCEKNEKTIIGAYEEALEEELPEEMKSLLSRHLIDIIDAYDSIIEIKKSKQYL